MKTIHKSVMMFCLTIFLLLNSSATYGENAPAEIEVHKMCPLCGMYPARYRTFQCQIVFTENSYEAFDSPQGLLIYLLFPEKTEISVVKPHFIYYRDYIDGSWIRSADTYYVVGTGVMGPMGLDFLPVKGKSRAEQLNKEEEGALVIHHSQVDRAFMIKAANSGWAHFLARQLILE
ncbi:MAG: hypothetical protein HOD92_06710 [Deltaproteobacteria bacterium]|jgi:copper chaperone NosL|nr:hypothetical protein [Deltaproteobacteria bacterium]